MQVFLTGATGYVGAALAAAFRARGHEVVALVRSPRSVDQARSAGLVPVLGSLRECASFRDHADRADVIVHAALEYDANGNECSEVDAAATSALLDAAHRGAKRDGERRHVLYTSNAFLLSARGGSPVDEGVDTGTMPVAWRFGVERTVTDAAGSGVATAVVRLGLVYGGNGGTVPSLFRGALTKGAAVYVGDGSARWSFVYVHDLAALYVRIAEAGGSGICHGVDGVPLRLVDVADTVARATGVPGGAQRVTMDAAEALVGSHTADIMTRDVAVSSERAFKLGWRPRFASFAIGASVAFQEWQSASV